MAMIFSDQCWLKDKCKKFNNPKIECECRTQSVYCEKLFRLKYLYDAALLTPAQYKMAMLYCPDKDPDYEQFGKLGEIINNIDTFVAAGRNVYIHSPICGNGKTTWAIKLLQAYLNKTWMYSSLDCKALFINVPRFLLALKDSISNQNEYVDHIKKYVLSADLVVWDEIATKSLTPYEHEHLLSLINARLDYGKSNVYTSNLEGSELYNRLGDRLYSRITGTLVEDIRFTSTDKRSAIKAEVKK